MANDAFRAKNWPAFTRYAEALHGARPWNSEYMTLAVLGYAATNDRSKAYEMMLKMQQQGLAQDFDRYEQTEAIRETEAYAYINDLMVRASEPAGEAELVSQLPASLLLPDALTWDPSRESLLVGNVRDGTVFRVDESGQTEALIAADEQNGLMGIYSLLVDAAANRLWVTSSASKNHTGYQPAQAGSSALFEFELDSLKRVAVYPVPKDDKPHRLGDMVMVNGDLYVVDSIIPQIYRLKSGDKQLKPFVRSADNVSLRGITASDDGKKLYLADYEMGISVLDLEASSASRLQGPPNLNFGGIESLHYYQGHLVVVQSGNQPERVMRLTLSDDGQEVTNVAPLAIAQPFFNHPTDGVVHDDKLYFLAGSHRGGSAQDLTPVAIASTSIASAPDLVSPDVDKFWDDYYKSKGLERPDKPSVSVPEADPEEGTEEG